MFHPLCWTDDACSDQILKQNTNALVTIKFYPLCGQQTKKKFSWKDHKCASFLQQDLHLWAQLVCSRQLNFQKIL